MTAREPRALPEGGTDPHQVIPSPRDTLLPFISNEDASKLAYPPNVMPGQRDVVTPYGTIRVNEWGPESGPKVLFLHGDSTPSPIWSKVAHGLTKRGCRVLTMDLWGRGYSDTPLNVVYDVRLYSSEVLYAVTSSPLSWITGDGFSIVGFSLGGGIAINFASTFPQFLSSVVLLAPTGLLRKMPGEYADHYLHHPEENPDPDYLRALTGRLWEVELDNPSVLKYTTSTPFSDSSKPEPALPGHDWAPTELSMAGLVQWQWDYHKGALHTFTNTVKHGAIQFHYAMWERLGKILSHKASNTGRLYGSRILCLFGRDDNVIIPQETREDILQFVPEEHVEFTFIDGGHGFLYPESEKIVQIMSDFWKLR